MDKSKNGNYYNVRLVDFDEVIVCDVHKQQAQCTYLYVNGQIFFAEMSNIHDNSTHGGSVESMIEYIKKYPNQFYNLYCLEHMTNYGGIYSNVRERMMDLQPIMTRDSKLNKILT